MRNTILSIILIILTLSAHALTAEPGFKDSEEWLEHLSPDQLTLLMEERELSRELNNNDPLLLIPAGNTAERIDRIRNGMRRYFGIEGLFFLPGRNEPETEVERDNIVNTLYNLALGVSTLEGMDYYSASRGFRRTLFHQFYRISESGSRTPLADIERESIPPVETFLVFQEDCTFGEDEYGITYHFEDPEISLTMKNMTSLKYSFIPIAGKEKLYMNVQIIPVREGIIFYGNCLVEGRKIPVPGKNINDSLYNRIKALMEWYKIRLNEAG